MSTHGRVDEFGGEQARRVNQYKISTFLSIGERTRDGPGSGVAAQTTVIAGRFGDNKIVLGDNSGRAGEKKGKQM